MRACASTAVVALALVAGCSGPSADPGRDAASRIPDGQFVVGELPRPAGGPSVTNASTVRSVLTRGRATSVNGLVPVGTASVLIGVGGDRGYWVINPGARDPIDNGQLSFQAGVQVSPLVAGSSLDLHFAAVALDGRVGPPFVVKLAIEDRPLPAGELVVSLDWATEADLDLHVVDPNGVEIWAKNQNSWARPAPPEVPDPTAWMSGGLLDFDSNAQCTVDGRRQENAVWKSTPPSGTYTVRVDAFSLCGETAAPFRVRVLTPTGALADVRGQLGPSDTRFSHGAGAGVLTTTFTLP